MLGDWLSILVSVLLGWFFGMVKSGLTGPVPLEVGLMAVRRLWRDMLCLRTPEANKIPRLTESIFRTCWSMGKGSLLLTATFRLQSNGLQFAVFAVVTPTLTTLVRSSLPSDGLDGSDVEVVPTEPRKEVTATTLVTSVTPPVVSNVISKSPGLWMAIQECVYWTELMH